MTDLLSIPMLAEIAISPAMMMKIIAAPVLLFSLVLHEYAHARTALHFGDPTARDMGRLTLNPIAHLDPMGTIALFLIGFGWAKPVPINPNFFRRKGFADFMVSFAGPLTNITLAVIVLLATRVLMEIKPELLFEQTNRILFDPATGTLQRAEVPTMLMGVIMFCITINIALFVFNLLPLYPLDGHHMLREILPAHLRYGYMQWQYQYGGYMLLAVMFLPMFLNFPSFVGISIAWVKHHLMALVFSL